MMAEKSVARPPEAAQATAYPTTLGSSSQITAASSAFQTAPPDPQHTADIAPLPLSASYQTPIEADEQENLTETTLDASTSGKHVITEGT